MTSTFGQLTSQHPLLFLAVCAPAMAALIVFVYNSGAGGLRRYLARQLINALKQNSWNRLLITNKPNMHKSALYRRTKSLGIALFP